MEIDIKGYIVLIDEEDYEKVMKYTWQIATREAKKGLYYFYTDIYKNNKPKRIMLHRYLMDCIPHDGKIVDHKNGKTLDNQKENLRFCSHGENMRNSKKRRNNTSGYKGVTYYKSRNKWTATLMVNRKSIFLGYFTTPELAYKAYCEAVEKYDPMYGRIE